MNINNPKDFILNQLSNQMNNPMISSLIAMAKNGKGQNIETFARNFCKERGTDFDKEFANFMTQFKK